MSTQAVLFDAPGPKARLRHRIFTVIGALLALGILYLVYVQFEAAGQLKASMWEPFVTDPEVWTSYLIPGLRGTFTAAAISIVLAVVFGLLFGMGRLSPLRPLRWFCGVIVEFFRAVPVLLLMIFIFYWLSIGGGPLSPLWCVVFALTLYNGAVLAEVFRAGVNAVPKGQAEAGYALGMRKSQVMLTIQLPQAVKIMLPSLISQCVVALKDTSLGYYIAAPGLTAVARPIYQEFANQVPTAIVISAIYITVNLLLTALATWVQHRLIGEKNPIDLTNVGNMQGGRAV